MFLYSAISFHQVYNTHCFTIFPTGQQSTMVQFRVREAQLWHGKKGLCNNFGTQNKIYMLFVFFGVTLLAGVGVLMRDYIATVSLIDEPVLLVKDADQLPNVNTLDSVPICTADQLNTISVQLDFAACAQRNFRRCELYKRTRCNDNSWLLKYFETTFSTRATATIEGFDQQSFLGLCIGCNKGYDAIHTARMGFNNPKFDKKTWEDALNGTMTDYACPRNTAQFNIVTNEPMRKGEVHCVEPMPSTFQSLKKSEHDVGIGGMAEHRNSDVNDGSVFVITNAAISSSNGVIAFPKPDGRGGNAGKESIGLDVCTSRRMRGQCVDVPMFSLETYVQKYVKSKGPINILSIDVEGFDFDVLFGAGKVLDRTEYIEFEYHHVGNWKNYNIMTAVGLLDTKGFTCYWTGDGDLWRITKCKHEFYDKWHDWSNVACVHRSQKELANSMETLFLDTLKKV